MGKKYPGTFRTALGAIPNANPIDLQKPILFCVYHCVSRVNPVRKHHVWCLQLAMLLPLRTTRFVGLPRSFPFLLLQALFLPAEGPVSNAFSKPSPMLLEVPDEHPHASAPFLAFPTASWNPYVAKLWWPAMELMRPMGTWTRNLPMRFLGLRTGESIVIPMNSTNLAKWFLWTPCAFHVNSIFFNVHRKSD